MSNFFKDKIQTHLGVSVLDKFKMQSPSSPDKTPASRDNERTPASNLEEI